MRYQPEDEFDEDEEREDFDDEEVEDDPNDPSHPDYDLSESAPWHYVGQEGKPWFLQRWVFLILAVVIISSLILPFLPR